MPSAPKWLFDTVDMFLSKLPRVEVVDTVYLSKSIKKIRFQGDFDNLSFPVGAFMDFRVSDTEARRYTVSYVDIENEILEFIVHLHGQGVGCMYMDNLKVGDIINLNKPRGERNYYDKTKKKVVLFGDETSLGLACSFHRVLKKNGHQFQFYFEMDNENKDICSLLGLQNCTIFPKDGNFRDQGWVSHLPIITSAEWQDAYFVLTGNVNAAKTFKKVIKQQTNGKVYLHGYWLEGKKGL
ncbi:FAD-binding oxidoreductase [Anditalea andensis]|uniref:Oxidoreductase n=1 Tax=Anditalea andensis TaxID=1048983 RepID=A0A074L4C2_9BACT|nr:FAD-binding oxidoreductase [Anditalea andensis]KEO75340.1 oxidoreductase [Anditalea andensis]